jgi:prepilin-type processing-associated H-X9-DG protein
VVVAIIALLISILLPALHSAREAARSAKCGGHLHGIGTGLHTYFAENDGWIPGVNTSGIAIRARSNSDNIGWLRQHKASVQSSDWMTAIVTAETDTGDNRAKRFSTMLSLYSCPSEVMSAPLYFGDARDTADFTDGTLTWPRGSYLMPVYFQLWSERFKWTTLFDAGHSTVYAAVPYDFWSVELDENYRSRVDKVGLTARKILLADGTRHVGEAGDLTTDVDPRAGYHFGSFATAGGWWAGSTAYGVSGDGTNWDGQPITRGSKSDGRNLALSYRHGQRAAGTYPIHAQENKGAINALFFDGHVALLYDRASREIEYWYPKGSRVRSGEEFSGLTSVPADFVIP